MGHPLDTSSISQGSDVITNHLLPGVPMTVTAPSPPSSLSSTLVYQAAAAASTTPSLTTVTGTTIGGGGVSLDYLALHNGTESGTVQQVFHSVVSKQPFRREDIMKMRYDALHNFNLSSEEWLNYLNHTCRYQAPRGFFKDILEPSISVSGIIGIMLTMVVLSRKTMVNSTNCYLTSLAVADLICLLLLLSRIVLAKAGDCRLMFGSEISIFNHYDVIFMEIFSYTSIGVTVMLAVERYIAICQPMQAMAICTVRRARIIILVIFLIAFILCVPKFFELKISYGSTMSNQTVLLATWVFPYNEQVYVCLVQGFLVTVLPFCCLLALNIRLIMEIRRSTRYLQVCLGADWQMRSAVTREEIKITMMLISVVVAFFLCQAPFMVFNLLMSLLRYDVVDYPMLTNENFIEVFKHVVQCLLALKSSCNFVLYCWFSEKFWTTFKRLFCLRHCLPRQGINHANGCSNNNSHNHSQNHNHRPSWHITRETTC